MSTRSVSLSSMFSWVLDSFRLFGRNLGTLAGASALTLLAFIAMGLPLWIGMFSGLRGAAAAAPGALPFGGNMTAFFVSYGITVVLSLLLFPAITLGWFRLCRALDAGQPATATAVFGGFRDGWLRALLYALLGFLMFVVLAGVFYLGFRDAIGTYMQQAMAAQAAALAGAPPEPVLPSGSLVLGYLLFIAVMAVLQFAYLVGFGDVALADRGPVAALGRALSATLRNLHKLVAFGICMMIAGILAGLAFALVAAILMFLLSLLGPAVAMAGIFLLYLPILLVLYPLMFAFAYFAWRGLLGEEPAATPEVGGLVA